MITETAIYVVVFAVNICRDCSANTDEFGTGHDSGEQALWNANFQQLFNRNTRAATQNPGICIQRRKTVQKTTADYLIIELAISVASAGSSWD